MELISRSLLNKLINTQFEAKQELCKDKIYKKYKIKPYKREGKIYLYKLSDVHSIGINYVIPKKGFYPIPSFEDKFWLSKDGEIMDVFNSRKISTHVGIDGYEHVTLNYYGKNYRKRVHSLMGKTFLGNPPVVNHIDGNKSNNVLSNLEKSTHQKNIQHAYDNNYYSTRDGKGTSVITKNKTTGEERDFPSLRKAQKATGVDRHRIKRIIEGENRNSTNWEFKFK